MCATRRPGRVADRPRRSAASAVTTMARPRASHSRQQRAPTARCVLLCTERRPAAYSNLQIRRDFELVLFYSARALFLRIATLCRLCARRLRTPPVMKPQFQNFFQLFVLQYLLWPTRGVHSTLRKYDRQTLTCAIVAFPPRLSTSQHFYFSTPPPSTPPQTKPTTPSPSP